ncbi:PH domain-containing protein [Streptomyces sp. DSM 44915]|uniref:PH domain-containing protein n=1 Tax=Streptomyces chisholmiae TaxID=3075540 RepID=A0ABU2JMV7_9ACTN|nr:PH domain-containing protein [Streptomyces sp. DSM 44915]MDT0265864.1 PH domain-containing protein [Streptomyces sp. DSM 44915]
MSADPGEVDRLPADPAEAPTADPDPPAGNGADTAWRRLDPRVIAAVGAWCLLLVLAAALVMWWRGAPWWLHVSVPAPVLGVLGYEALRWRRTTYRVTSDLVELRTGVLVRGHRSIPRQRVRSVDVTAEPMHRLLGIATVKVGTGQRVSSSAGAALTLDALAAEECEALRERLSRRPDDPAADGGRERTLAVLDWRWLRYAPLSMSVPLLGLSFVGALYEGLDLLGADPDNTVIPGLIAWLGSVDDLWPVVLLAVVAMALAGTVGSLGMFVETWWGFRLLREPHGTLRTSRGLFVARSVTLEEARLRGVEVAEPLSLRWGGGALTYAVVTGAGTAEEEISASNSSVLLPPAPLRQAHRVAAAVLREERDPTAAVRLIPHTRHALHRRLRLVCAVGTSLGGVLALLGTLLTPVLIHLGWVTALVVYAVGCCFAVDAYRNLGHGVTGRYLVTRHGSLKRRTIALRRDGVVGWRINQWAWQRRSGLCRVTATTAGGRGAYHVKDVLLPEGLRFADEAVPDLLTRFLVRRDGAPADDDGAPRGG